MPYRNHDEEVFIDDTAPAPAKRRYDVEDVAQFIENCLRNRSQEEQAKWAGLPAKIRAYPHPFFYTRPDARIVDCVGFKAAQEVTTTNK